MTTRKIVGALAILVIASVGVLGFVLVSRANTQSQSQTRTYVCGPSVGNGIIATETCSSSDGWTYTCITNANDNAGTPAHCTDPVKANQK